MFPVSAAGTSSIVERITDSVVSKKVRGSCFSHDHNGSFRVRAASLDLFCVIGDSFALLPVAGLLLR